MVAGGEVTWSMHRIGLRRGHENAAGIESDNDTDTGNRCKAGDPGEIGTVTVLTGMNAIMVKS